MLIDEREECQVVQTLAVAGAASSSTASSREATSTSSSAALIKSSSTTELSGSAAGTSGKFTIQAFSGSEQSPTASGKPEASLSSALEDATSATQADAGSVARELTDNNGTPTEAQVTVDVVSSTSVDSTTETAAAPTDDISVQAAETATNEAVDTASSVEAAPEDGATSVEAATPTADATVESDAGAASDEGAISASGDEAAAAESATSSAFVIPGQKLSVLPIGLGVFAGVSALALLVSLAARDTARVHADTCEQVVGIVTYERRKYRRQFRERKAAEAISRAGGFVSQVPAS